MGLEEVEEPEVKINVEYMDEAGDVHRETWHMDTDWFFRDLSSLLSEGNTLLSVSHPEPEGNM